MMDTTLRRLLAVLLWSLAAMACDGGTRTSSSVTAAEAHALVADGATLLDVRTDGEWAAGHLEGALHVPVDEVPARMAEIPKDRPVIVYCASGRRSASATSVLREAGYDARNLGGMSRW